MTGERRPPDAGADAVERLDLRGLKCPLPVMRTRRRLEAAAPGARLIVETTDPMSAIDIPHLCRSEGHRLIASERDGAVLTFRIEARRAGFVAEPEAPGEPDAPDRGLADQPKRPEKPEM
jgi:tRNA 2-thiouridine synthesizing protein A